MSKVYHLSDLEGFYGDENWKLTIDITDIWNQFTKQELSVKDFNINYYNRLISYKNDIVAIGSEAWNELLKPLDRLKTEVDETKMNDVYDGLYDFADKFDILIKTK